jgi:CDP-diacylglycerol--glycerol-3-phosphate 3-phosphatidyltransferase
MGIKDLYRAGRSLAEQWAKPTIARLPLTPLAWTISGLILHVAVATLLAWGFLRWAAALQILAGICDVADGAIARVTEQESKLGAFLDATLDRYSESLVGLGLLIYNFQHGTQADQILLYLFISSSLIFSYTRARAQAEGLDAPLSIFTRFVRVSVLAVGLLLGQLRVTLWILVIGVIGGALHRLLAVYMKARPRVTLKTKGTRARWIDGLRSRWSIRYSGRPDR